MNTVEVTVEQVLAGIIGLVVCVLPFVQPAAVADPWLPKLLKRLLLC